MFKVIKDFVPEPGMLLCMCDRACGTYAQAQLQAGPNAADAQQPLFANELLRQGWKITLAEHVCPTHVKQEAGEKSLIYMPSASGFKN
jgi:hypothetical protein